MDFFHSKMTMNSEACGAVFDHTRRGNMPMLLRGSGRGWSWQNRCVLVGVYDVYWRNSPGVLWIIFACEVISTLILDVTFARGLADCIVS